jgi:DNA-binding NarL/FixJ family response regulator
MLAASLQKGKPAPMRLLLVDDHGLFRKGMILQLREFDPRIEVDDAASCEAAGAFAGRAYDLILADLKMPGVNGLAVIGAMRRAFAESPLVVLSGEDDREVMKQAFELGAVGFIPKSSSPEAMKRALQIVLARGIYVPHEVLYKPDEVSQLSLTERQLDVLRCMVRGKTTDKEIARALGMAENTAGQHLQAIRRKLNVKTRAAAVIAAMKLGLRFG